MAGPAAWGGRRDARSASRLLQSGQDESRQDEGARAGHRAAAISDTAHSIESQISAVSQCGVSALSWKRSKSGRADLVWPLFRSQVPHA